MKENIKIIIISCSLLLVMLLGVLFFNNIVKDDKEDESERTVLNDYNNVPTVDAKLGDDIEITQSYLLNYVTRKVNYWYESSGVVKKIVKDKEDSYITISDGDNELVGVIDTSKVKVSKNDKVNFVGIIDFSTGNLKLSKISNDNINYNSSTKIEFDELVNNIKLVRSNYFVVIGYLVKDQDEYKLFDSKNDYENNNKYGNYFKVEFNDKVDINNKDVNIKCNIGDTYKLTNCSIVK